MRFLSLLISIILSSDFLPELGESWIPYSHADSLSQRKLVIYPDSLLLDPVILKPTFDGGDIDDFAKWVYDHLNYPEEAKINGVQGRVKVSFTISEEGKLTKVKIVESLHPLLDQEAVRVIIYAPDKWTPGRMTGQGEPVPIPVSYTFPVFFRLSKE